MNPHPAAQIFPTLAGAAFRELVDDIRQHGLLEPIIVLDGRILDGRTRFQACRAAGVKPRFEEYRETVHPIDYVLGKNLHRRHLTPSQRAAAAALADKLMRSEKELAAKRRAQAPGKRRGAKAASVPDGGPEQSTGDARDRVGEAFGVSGRQVDRARRLRERDPARFEAVQNGDKSISAALREALRDELAMSFPTGERARVLALIGAADVSEGEARQIASNLRRQPVEERRRIYELHASELPRDVRLARNKAMGLTPGSDPVLAELSELATRLQGHARREFTGNSRVRLFEAAELIQAVVESEERRVTKLYKGVFAGAEQPRTNGRPSLQH